MPNNPSSRPLGVRLAAWLGFLAVFAALLAPVSTLAEDVRTGQFGGLCSAMASQPAADDDSASALGHCDLCGSAGLGLSPLERGRSDAPAVTAMAHVSVDAVRSAASPGLPFSRGPPAL